MQFLKPVFIASCLLLQPHKPSFLFRLGLGLSSIIHIITSVAWWLVLGLSSIIDIITSVAWWLVLGLSSIILLILLRVWLGDGMPVINGPDCWQLAADWSCGRGDGLNHVQYRIYSEMYPQQAQHNSRAMM